MSEDAAREPDVHATPHPRLRHVGEEAAPVPPSRSEEAVARLVSEHRWLVDRTVGRLAARWPEELSEKSLQAESVMALREVAATVERPGLIADVAAEAITRRLRALLAASEWYRSAVIGRARPLCEAWRGALLGGRQPTDPLLRRRLHINGDDLRERFAEMALVFGVDPRALLPSSASTPVDVSRVIATLPADRQLATSLYFSQELTYAEIARVMGVEPAGAQELVGRAVTAMVGEAGLAHWPGRRLTA